MTNDGRLVQPLAALLEGIPVIVGDGANLVCHLPVRVGNAMHVDSSLTAFFVCSPILVQHVLV